MSERDIQRAILSALSQAFHPHGVFWTADTGVARSMDGKRVIKFGLVGQADVQGCIGGRWVGVEVKALRGRQRESQRRFQAAVEAAGGVYVIARSPTEAVAALRAAVPAEATLFLGPHHKTPHEAKGH